MEPASPVSPRQRAAALFADGQSRAQVARALGVCRATAGDWYRVWQEGGAAALVARKRRGRPPKIDAAALEGIHRHLHRSPRCSGFDLDTWSLAAVVALIHRTTGIAYHPRHVARVLRRLGWVVAPIGASAVHAFRELPHRDPDGNEILLRQHAATDG